MQTLTLAPSRSFLLPASSPRLRIFLVFRSPFSFSSSSPSSPSSSRRTESLRQQNTCDEESKAIKVSVWWDYENCPIPAEVNVYRIANRIVSALRFSGIRGPVSINAFGDMWRMPRITQEALISTGVCLTHAPNSGKNSADRLLMADLISWTAHNPPPAHFFLISSDSDFATILHRLRMNNYNVLLSCIDIQAKASLYGAATLMWPWVPLAKGGDFTPQQFNHPPDGIYGSWYGLQKGLLDNPFEELQDLMEKVAEMETTTVPKSVVNGICQVLRSHPDGISLSILRGELRRKNIINDDLCGFRKFSNLIYSRPDIFTPVPPPDGKKEIYVVLTRKRSAKLVHEPVEPPCVEESAESAERAELEQVAIKPDGSVKQTQESSETVQMVEPSTEPVKSVDPCIKKKSVNLSLELDTEKANKVDDLDKDIFGRFKRVFFGSHKNSEEAVPVVVKCEKDSSGSVPASVPVVKDKLTENNRKDEPKEELAMSDRGLFRRLVSWFGFGREKEGSNLFADRKLWSDVESFLTSLEGSDLVAKSRTREELMQGLHKAGMPFLKSLEEAHLIQLIDLLILEKKWIRENTSSTFPFTLSIPSASTPSATSQENLPQSIADPDKLSIKKPPSKRKMLSDCRKLVKEMLDEHPEGFQMGNFKPRFESKFGYVLKNKKLGYPKLVSLLQIIPGTSIDLSGNKVYKYDEKEKKIEADNIGEVVTDSNEEDSGFDELGPVSKEMDVGYHEPSLSDEEFSDESETEVSADFNRETRKDQSSLIKILDTFSSMKKRDPLTKEPSGHDGIVDCSRRHENNKSELWLGDNVRNTRSLRSQKGLYKFVADEVEDDKGKIVDSILGTLKKNGGSSVMVEGKGI